MPICPGLFSVPWHFPHHLTAHLDACSCSLERLGTTLRKLEAGTEPKVGIPRMPSILPLGGAGKSERGTRELLRAEGSRRGFRRELQLL